jgi:hypothetical protein
LRALHRRKTFLLPITSAENESAVVFKLGDRLQCKSGIRVCKFVVPHRAGLKAVFGNTVVDSLVIS